MTRLSVLWAFAYGICPQRPSHSLFLGGQQMPIEARMAGIFGGYVIGVAYFWALRRERAMRLPGRAMATPLIGFIALMGMDGLNALLSDVRLPHLYTPNLPLRLGTGLLTGLAPLTNVRHLLGGLLLEALYFGVAISGAGIFLYPVSLMAVLGVPLVWGMIGSIVINTLRVSRQENRAIRAADLIPPVLGGLAVA